MTGGVTPRVPRWLAAAGAAVLACAVHAQPAPQQQQPLPKGLHALPLDIPKPVPGQVQPYVVPGAPGNVIDLRKDPGLPLGGVPPAAPKDPKKAKAKPNPAAEWTRGNRVTLEALEKQIGFRGSYTFERTAAGEVRVTIHEQRRAGEQSGTLIVVGADALLARDLKLVRGPVLPALDGPMILLNLVHRLLEIGVPEGPRAVHGERRIARTEKGETIRIFTPSAQGEFRAPWTLNGTVRRKGGAIVFDLLLVTPSRVERGQLNNTVLRGTWRNDRKPLVLPDGYALEGWTLYSIQPIVKEVNRNQTVEYVAARRTPIATLGELRRAIQEGWVHKRDPAFRPE
jgi:hypothetical protein